MRRSIACGCHHSCGIYWRSWRSAPRCHLPEPERHPDRDSKRRLRLCKRRGGLVNCVKVKNAHSVTDPLRPEKKHIHCHIMKMSAWMDLKNRKKTVSASHLPVQVKSSFHYNLQIRVVYRNGKLWLLPYCKLWQVRKSIKTALPRHAVR